MVRYVCVDETEDSHSRYGATEQLNAIMDCVRKSDCRGFLYTRTSNSVATELPSQVVWFVLLECPS